MYINSIAFHFTTIYFPSFEAKRAHKVFPELYDFVSIARWRDQMEIFTALLAICEGNPPVDCPVDALHKGQWLGALMFY